MSKLFNKIQLAAFKAGITPRTKESRTWFMNKVKSLRSARIDKSNLLNSDDMIVRKTPRPGSMYMFYYDAKTKEQLPVWDAFPLIIMVDAAPGGFYGLNLHYLPPILRAKMLDALMDTLTNTKYDESTAFNINYQMLKRLGGMKYYKACFKHYLMDHVQSHYAEVQPTEWEIATFVPTASWQKGTANDAYRMSRRVI